METLLRVNLWLDYVAEEEKKILLHMTRSEKYSPAPAS